MGNGLGCMTPGRSGISARARSTDWGVRGRPTGSGQHLEEAIDAVTLMVKWPSSPNKEIANREWLLVISNRLVSQLDICIVIGYSFTISMSCLILELCFIF